MNFIKSIFLTTFTLILMIIPASSDVWTFETPSKNIQCSIDMERDFSAILCTIITRYGPPALPRPLNCRKGWGHTFTMGDKGKAGIECIATDTNKGGYGKFTYGSTQNFSGINCSSSKRGLTCTNRDGHGFFLSRRTQRVF